METIERRTSCGTICGRSFNDYVQYRGIKYATAARWKYPTPVDSWEGVYDATEYGDCSYQRRSFEDDTDCNPFYHKEFRKGMDFTYSEDSLYLNIWSPRNPDHCPVIIYIHGGSFTGGSSNEAHISGSAFAKKGTMFVSFNYRLGPFGFCSHPALTNAKGICGNFGLFDQYTAIQWVRNHIASFGGNPENITLMGQSAGAMSVDIHCSSPMEKGWFAGIVMSSGAGLQRLFLKPKKPAATEKFWKVVMDNARVTSIEELRQVDPKTLYYAWFDACKSVKFSIAYTMPVQDGQLLTRNSFSTKSIPHIPCMVGMTTNDMMPAVMHRLLMKWTRYSTRHGNGSCYTYLFARQLPGDQKGAWHSSDFLYFFSTLQNNWRPFTPVDEKISTKMSESLLAFAKKHNPNCPAISKWEPGFRKPMVFDEDISQITWNTRQLLHNTISKGEKE